MLNALNVSAGEASIIAPILSAPSSADFAKALKTTSEVNNPFDAKSFNLPEAMPVSSDMAFSSCGTCSAILLNSSPCRRPEPKPCASCVNAALASVAFNPANFAIVLKPMKVVSISFKEIPRGLNLAKISVTPFVASTIDKLNLSLG